MKTFPDYLKPNIINKDLHYTEECMKLLRNDVTLYILTQNLSLKFFNLSDFFLRNKINNDEVKQNLNKNILQELKDFGWTVANLFNNTSIVICQDDEQLNKSVWKTTLDFKII